MKVEKFLLISFVSIFIYLVILMKILGATSIPIDVEKNGYCKIVYGEDWKNLRGSNVCKSKYSYSNNLDPITFTDEEFRNRCPKNQIISFKFNSDCFYESGSIV